MTDALKGYLLSITAACLLLSVMQILLPKGPVKQIGVLCGCLLVLLTVLSPVAKLDYEDISQSLSKIQLQTEAAETGITVQNQELMASIIKQRCETYILDKADELGLSLEVEIKIAQGTSYPYPDGVILIGYAGTAQKQSLTHWITENLGIPEERQEWRS